MKSQNSNHPYSPNICIKKVCILTPLIISIVILSCKKLVEIGPPVTSLTGQNVYTNDATAASVLSGIYGSMGVGSPFIGSSGISLRTGLSADELDLWSGGFNGGDLQRLYQNNLTANLPINSSYWVLFYQRLLTINSALEGLEASSSLNPDVKNQLQGEALFLRAFFHFYLVNFYGDVPLTLSSDWRINAIAPRTPKAEVYQQVINDLKKAQNILSDKYLQADAMTTYNGGEERVRPNKWAATALLARVYLYVGEWGKAENEATLLIDNHSMYKLNSLDGAFAKNSTEAIWQIQYVNSAFGTEGFHFILTSSPNSTRPTYLSSFLVNAFEPGDQRATKWIKSFTSGINKYYYPYKYKVQNNPNSSEYFMVLRLAEQFLIRAEARAQQNKILGAIDDLDKVRLRAELPLIAITEPGIGKSELLNAILHERQVELFLEWGHRWFDLKRTATIDSVMSQVYSVKNPSGSWNTNWQLYPLSESDINLNPNLAPNNPGY